MHANRHWAHCLTGGVWGLHQSNVHHCIVKENGVNLFCAWNSMNVNLKLLFHCYTATSFMDKFLSKKWHIRMNFVKPVYIGVQLIKLVCTKGWNTSETKTEGSIWYSVTTFTVQCVKIIFCCTGTCMSLPTTVSNYACMHYNYIQRLKYQDWSCAYPQNVQMVCTY